MQAQCECQDARQASNHESHYTQTSAQMKLAGACECVRRACMRWHCYAHVGTMSRFASGNREQSFFRNEQPPMEGTRGLVAHWNHECTRTHAAHKTNHLLHEGEGRGQMKVGRKGRWQGGRRQLNRRGRGTITFAASLSPPSAPMQTQAPRVTGTKLHSKRETYAVLDHSQHINAPVSHRRSTAGNGIGTVRSAS